MRRSNGRPAGGIAGRGKVISGKSPLMRELKLDGLREQTVRDKALGTEAERYESIADYDPVLSSNCRMPDVDR